MQNLLCICAAVKWQVQNSDLNNNLVLRMQDIHVSNVFVTNSPINYFAKKLIRRKI